MRFRYLTLLGILAGATLAHASSLPVGNYYLTAVPGSGEHVSLDTGTMTGFLTFDASSDLIAANLVFDDTTSGIDFTFTDVSTSTDIDPVGHTLAAEVINSVNPAFTYAFSIRIPGFADGSFELNCGTDCDTDAEINDGAGNINEELVGSIVPTPEPGSFVLIGTGALGVLGAVRRRLIKA
jgi:hypothetical protein